MLSKAHLLTNRHSLEVESKEVGYFHGIVARAVLAIDLVEHSLHMQLIVRSCSSDVLGKVNTHAICDGS